MEIKSTYYQRGALNFCSFILGVEFKGNVESFREVHEFLDKYLEKARETNDILEGAYEKAYINM